MYLCHMCAVPPLLRSLEKRDAVGRWETFRIRQYDPICQHWLILHKVDNNDQMRCGSSRV